MTQYHEPAFSIGMELSRFTQVLQLSTNVLLCNFILLLHHISDIILYFLLHYICLIALLSSGNKLLPPLPAFGGHCDPHPLWIVASCLYIRF